MSLIQTKAISVDEARGLISNGQVTEGFAMLDSLSISDPKNSEIDYIKGEYFAVNGDLAKAEEWFDQSQKKGNTAAILQLADIAIKQYNPTKAQTYINNYKTAIKKVAGQKDNSATIESSLKKMQNMLERVEQIEVIDSIVVDKAEFFRHYKLSPEAGSLHDASVLPDNVEAIEGAVVYLTEDGRKMMWASEGDSIVNIYAADKLIGVDEWDEPENQGARLSDGGVLNYPFLMPDGVKLYYASNGENSLGGYDIFVSRNNGTEFLQPQNIGMPYNSPFDDYMLAIDEMTGIGWWATDRNQIPGKLTIYLFIPSDSRVNIPKDDEQLIEKARLSSIALTQSEDADYTDLINKIKQIRPVANKENEALFSFAMPDGSIRINPLQFKTQRGKEGINRYMELTSRLADEQSQLNDLRARYGNGETQLAQQIKNMEIQRQKDLSELQRLVNDIVKAETSAR